ncbi:cysteine synthase family protein [Bacteroides sp. 519]|uniref:cysteine synthase family protein n=1 Tax=Bacteroides sp. 519 TaxID=2302937 RepID=UPI0013D5C3A9|nr:cysteine synthase family protein [Bacteroides sp. 519]NDV57976.1 cysteine synthase family protein [Bacteroides sp. 519]
MKNLSDYNIGNTSLYYASKYSSSCKIFLKMEMQNFLGSIKSRTAFFILKDLYDSKKINKETTIIESTSGNLGISLSFFATEFNVRFLCLIDPTIRPSKLEKLKKLNTEIIEVKKNGTDYRSSRIMLANKLGSLKNHIWVNQYKNLSNVKAHYKTTGPEIWEQTKGNIDYLISAVGSGGTISGIALYLKQKSKKIKIIGVEPFGSCIFGGFCGEYINAGAGMAEPSDIIQSYLYLIDDIYKVRDIDAIYECNDFYNKEGVVVGHTSGMCLFAAKIIQQKSKDARILVIASDNEIINI